MVAKFDDELTAPDEKQLIFIFVTVPWKGAQTLHQLDLLPVQFRDDLWPQRDILDLEFTDKPTSKALQPDMDAEAILLAKIEKLSEAEAEALLRARVADTLVNS